MNMILNRQDARNAKVFDCVAAQGATKPVAPVRRRECSLNIREYSASPLAVNLILK